MKRYTNLRSQVRRHAANFTVHLVLSVAVVMLLVSASLGLYGIAPAAGLEGPIYQADATATAAGTTVPGPVETPAPPAAQPTTEGANPTVPVPEETRLAQARDATEAASLPTATTEPTISPSDAPVQPGATNPAPTQTTGTGTAAASTDFPWLPALLIGALLLGALLFLLSRRRRPEPVVAVAPHAAPAVAQPYDLAASTAGTPVALASTASAVSAPAPQAPAPFVPPVMPSTLDCPNCGTSNGINENFCHECGQDLRPTRAALVAASTPPPDVITETTPYLETMSRVDEQLEYVLSRPRVLIGTAPGSDIVIDSLFSGWETVDPAHAELRRESDGFVLVDRGSGAGTYVNEMRTGENLLSDGDVIRVGDVKFVFRVPS